MIKIECGDCRCDLNTGDVVFCEDCMKKVEKTIGILEQDIETLKKIIDDAEVDVDILHLMSGQ